MYYGTTIIDRRSQVELAWPVFIVTSLAFYGCVLGDEALEKFLKFIAYLFESFFKPNAIHGLSGLAA